MREERGTQGGREDSPTRILGARTAQTQNASWDADTERVIAAPTPRSTAVLDTAWRARGPAAEGAAGRTVRS